MLWVLHRTYVPLRSLEDMSRHNNSWLGLRLITTTTISIRSIAFARNHAMTHAHTTPTKTGTTQW